MEEKILTVPVQANDSATTMAMMNNNPWMYLVMLALFNNGGFGGNRGNGALEIETQNKLNALANQINSNNNNEWAREAIQGNGFAISQLAQNLNVDVNSLRDAINTVNFGIAQLGNTTGMGLAGVTNAINLGNLNMIQQLKDCCCNMQTQVLNQGYQNQIQTINQTNDILTGVRVESGLTRAEINSFRQAWENARYQDVVAEKVRLQTELDLLRQQNVTSAALAPMQAQIQQMSYQMQVMSASAKTASAAA